MRGKVVAGVAPLGFGGWLVGLDEMIRHGADPRIIAREIVYPGTQTRTLEAVLTGRADLAVIRTGVLERAISQGVLAKDDVRIINERRIEGFPYVTSTELYPEWAFAKTPNADHAIAVDVVHALLDLPPGGIVARTGDYHRWVLPYDYRDVHNIMKRLQAGPYLVAGAGFSDRLWKNKEAIAIGLLVIVLVGSLAIAARIGSLSERRGRGARWRVAKDLKDRFDLSDAAVFLAGALVSGLAYVVLWHSEGKQIHQELQHLASEHSHLIQSRLGDQAAMLYSLKSLYRVSETVSPEQFRLFSQRILEEYPYVSALEWAPRVLGDDRDEFEMRMSDELNRKFEITERQGKLVSARDRRIYYPVVYVNPAKGNEGAIGYDLASEPIRATALHNASRGDSVAASSAIRLVQGAEGGEIDTGILIVLAIGSPGEGIGPPGMLSRCSVCHGWLKPSCRR
jgi:hypothetical protein